VDLDGLSDGGLRLFGGSVFLDIHFKKYSNFIYEIHIYILISVSKDPSRYLVCYSDLGVFIATQPYL